MPDGYSDWWFETCPECERVFDLTDETDADEYYSGHDCEVTDVPSQVPGVPNQR